jgi:hypothetical protein
MYAARSVRVPKAGCWTAGWEGLKKASGIICIDTGARVLGSYLAWGISY